MERYDISLYCEKVPDDDGRLLTYYGLRVVLGEKVTEYPCITQDKERLQSKVDVMLQADLFPIHLHDCIEDIVTEEATV